MAALDSAFTQPISLPSSTPSTSTAEGDHRLGSGETAPPPIPAPTPALSLSQSVVSDAEREIWKEQYEAYVAEWRTMSAAARQKAEETRERFEEIRAKEEEEAKNKGKNAEGGWEDVHPGRQPLPQTAGGLSTPSPADARDLVTGEKEGQHLRPAAADNNNGGIGSPTASLSHEHWEDVPSMASSFPSLPSHTTSPPTRARNHRHEHGPSSSHNNTDSLPPSSLPESSAEEKEEDRPKKSKDTLSASSQTHQPQARAIPSASGRPQPPAVTPLIFKPDVPVRTRALALLSSLAINMFLPFVNGVMLGFGEIFARNVLAPWIGWKSVVNPNGQRTLRPRTVSEPERQAMHRREQLRARQEPI